MSGLLMRLVLRGAGLAVAAEPRVQPGFFASGAEPVSEGLDTAQLAASDPSPAGAAVPPGVFAGGPYQSFARRANQVDQPEMSNTRASRPSRARRAATRRSTPPSVARPPDPGVSPQALPRARHRGETDARSVLPAAPAISPSLARDSLRPRVGEVVGRSAEGALLPTAVADTTAMPEAIQQPVALAAAAAEAAIAPHAPESAALQVRASSGGHAPASARSLERGVVQSRSQSHVQFESPAQRKRGGQIMVPDQAQAQAQVQAQARPRPDVAAQPRAQAQLRIHAQSPAQVVAQDVQAQAEVPAEGQPQPYVEAQPNGQPEAQPQVQPRARPRVQPPGQVQGQFQVPALAAFLAQVEAQPQPMPVSASPRTATPVIIAEQDHPPTIDVHIGRIDIRAPSPAATPKSFAASPPRRGFGDYQLARSYLDRACL